MTINLKQEQLARKQARAEIARANGAKSKGPVTAAGKRRSSANAIRHGMWSNRHFLLTTESSEEYNEVHNAFIDHLRPATKAELRLVQKIANLDWRLERYVMMETCIINLEVGISCAEVANRFGGIDGIGFVIEAWKGSSDSSHALDLIRRYMGTLQNQFNCALSNFRNFEKQRRERTARGEDDIPYEPPMFETLLTAVVSDDINRYGPDGENGEAMPQEEESLQPEGMPNAEASDEPANTDKPGYLPQRNEPSTSKTPHSFNTLLKPPKRPAA